MQHEIPVKQFAMITIMGGLLLGGGTSGTACAQSQSLFGSRGTAGQIGTNLTGSAVGRGSTAGVTSVNLSATGAALGTTTGGDVTGTGSGTASTFVGRNDSTGRFVGNQAAGNQTARSATRNFNTTGQGRTGESFGEMDPAQTGGSVPRFRPQLRVAFSHSARPRPDLSVALQQKFSRLTARDARIKSITVEADSSGVVVLRGEVDSIETRRLAELLAQLEPGVLRVQNELTVPQ